MEPEEIDKLFKDRLAGLPTMPSADAWQRLQQKMEPPKKERSLWIYYAAASVVILLISGILLIKTKTQNFGLANNNQQETKSTPLPHDNPLIIEKKQEETRVAKQTLPTRETPANKIIEPNNTSEKAAQQSIAVSLPKEYKEKQKNKLPKASNPAAYFAGKKASTNSANNDDSYKVADNTKLDKDVTTPFSLTDNSKSASDNALTASIVEVTVKKTYIEESAGDDNLRDNLAKKTMLLKNIYKQARNLKNGEPVELTALGVDKEKLQAETKEIKQKLNKVISL